MEAGHGAAADRERATTPRSNCFYPPAMLFVAQAAHLAWEATLEAWSGKEPELAALNERHGKPNQAVVAVLAKDPSLAGLAAQWHHFQWGPGACDVIQTVGQPQSLGATMNDFNEEMRHIISRGPW